MKIKFKSHMILWCDPGEGFSTVCGIDDACSEQFKDHAELVQFGHTDKTSCQKCLARFNKWVKEGHVIPEKSRDNEEAPLP